MKIERPSQEDQDAERAYSADSFKLPVTVLHGTHSCSIQCFGATQALADEQAEYILKLQEEVERLHSQRAPSACAASANTKAPSSPITFRS